jgi:hypothetical protein
MIALIIGKLTLKYLNLLIGIFFLKIKLTINSKRNKNKINKKLSVYYIRKADKWG